MSVFLFHFWEIVLLDIEFLFDVCLCPQWPKYVIPALRGLHGLWCEITCRLMEDNLYVRGCSNLANFRMLLLFFANLIKMCLSVNVFVFILLEFTETFGCVN